MTSWYQRIFLSYQPLAQDQTNPNSTTPPTNLPGAYFEDSDSTNNNDINEASEPMNRNRFNSQAINQYLQKISDIIQLVIFKPLIFCLYIAVRVLAKLINIIYFRDHFKLTDNNLQNIHNYDPVDKANKFIRDLEDSLPPISMSSSNNSSAMSTSSENSGNNLNRNIGNNPPGARNGTGNRVANTGAERLPPFYQGSYTQALYMATKKGKFLFVYLANSELESTSSIFNKIITNPKFISIFKDPNFIIWGGDLTNPEAYQLANSLNVTKFPFLGLLSLTRNTTMTPEGPTKTPSKISLLVKIQGTLGNNLTGDHVIDTKFIKKIQKYEPELKLIRNELSQVFIDQVFKRQQELNYQNSLAKDKLKKLQKRQAVILKKYLITKLEYFKQLEQSPPSDQEMAKIGLKLPNGERITKVFPTKLSIDDVFAYVELYRNDYFNKKFEDTNLDVTAEELAKFCPEYKFKLTSPLPPKVVMNEHLNQQKLIKDFNCIYPNGLLIVEDL